MNFYPIFTPIGVPSGGSLGWKGMILYMGSMLGLFTILIGIGVFGLIHPFGIDILFENPVFLVLHFTLGFLIGTIIVLITCRDEIDEEYRMKNTGEKSQ